jgi:light-regulated signal transduction histidine kinase (bacteriophytochrome)
MSRYSTDDLVQALRQCEAESIHQIGSVQSHGAIMVLSADRSRVILQVSENLADFLAIPPDDAVGKRLVELIGEAGAEQIEHLITAITPRFFPAGEVLICSQQRKRTSQARVFSSAALFVVKLTRVDAQTEWLPAAMLIMKAVSV